MSSTCALKWQILEWTTEKGSIFNTGPLWGSPLKIKISKIGLRHVLSWPKLGLKPKFHDPGTFGGFGKRGHTNRQDSCFISIDIYVLSHQKSQCHEFSAL